MAEVYSSTMDPLLLLPEGCLLQVLEFVGTESFESNDNDSNEENESASALRTALATARFYSSLVRVSKGWTHLLDCFIRQPSSLVHVEIKPTTDVISAILWLSRQRLRIGSLCCGRLAFRSQSSLLIRLLQDCDTTQLVHANIPIGSGQIDTLMEEQALQRTFQDVLATECPNLKRLWLEISQDSVLLWGVSNEHDQTYPGVSPLLFSRPSVEDVEVVIRKHSQIVAIEELFFSRMIENWQSLQSLSLKWKGPPCRYISDGPLLSIHSNSLKELSLENFCPWKHTQFSLNCPQLQGCSRIDETMSGPMRQSVLGVENPRCINHVGVATRSPLHSFWFAAPRQLFVEVNPLEPVRVIIDLDGVPLNAHDNDNNNYHDYDNTLEEIHNALNRVPEEGDNALEEVVVIPEHGKHQTLQNRRRNRTENRRQPRQLRSRPHRREWRR